MEKVLHLFMDGLRPKEITEHFNMFENCASLRVLNGFGEFTLQLPLNENGHAIRDAILKECFVDDAIKVLVKGYSIADKDSWKIDSMSLPALLKTLGGMAHGHEATQDLLLKHDLIPILLELESVVSKNSIGELAAVILENVDKESPSALQSTKCAKPALQSPAKKPEWSARKQSPNPQRCQRPSGK
jgi:hypothetical protein